MLKKDIIKIVFIHNYCICQNIKSINSGLQYFLHTVFNRTKGLNFKAKVNRNIEISIIPDNLMRICDVTLKLVSSKAHYSYSDRNGNL